MAGRTCPVVRQLGELDELFTVRLDHEVGRVNTLGDLRRRFFGDRYQPAALTKHVGRPSERVAAHRVEHEVDGLDASNEGRCRVQHLLGSEVPRELGGAGRSGADHVRPSPFRELRRKVADAAGRAEDEDALSRLQLAVHEEALPRRQPGERERGALGVAQALGLRSEERGRHDRELGGDTIAIERRQGEDVFADGEFMDVARRGPRRHRKARTTRSPAGGRWANRARLA